jgi:isoquinoline 1-oxidoreductase beta subunit
MPTWVACVVRIRVDAATGVVTVETLKVVTDAETIVDPDGAGADQGTALLDLSMALHEGTEFKKDPSIDENRRWGLLSRSREVADGD